MKEQIRQMLRARPFRPFTIVLTDGREFLVEEPFAAMAPPTPVPRVTVEIADGSVHTFPPRLVKELRLSQDARAATD